MNEISLTVRLPHELNSQLSAISKKVGITKTNLIRTAIHDFLTTDKTTLEFSFPHTDKRARIVLNVNQITFDILSNASEEYGQSVNAIVTAISILALERSSKWLQLAKH